MKQNSKDTDMKAIQAHPIDMKSSPCGAAKNLTHFAILATPRYKTVFFYETSQDNAKETIG